MAGTAPYGNIEVSAVSSMEEPRPARPEPEDPFRILVLGDFSGRGNRGVREPLAGRRLFAVDRDNLDELPGRLGVEVRLPLLGRDSPPLAVRFKELDDFHPDRLFEKAGVFDDLREMRRGLKDPATFSSIAGQIQEAGKPPEKAPSPRRADDVVAETLRQGGGGFLDQVLDATSAAPSRTGPEESSSGLSGFLRDIVAPHAVPKPEPRLAEMLSAVDAAAGELMRRILHHPDFQALEAAWRGLHFLISRLETGEGLKVYVLDATKEDLAADLSASSDLRRTALYKLLVEDTVETPGGEPWAAVVANYTFDFTAPDAVLLGRIAAIARRAGAPFIAAGHDHLIGCASVAETPRPEDWRWKPGKEAKEAWTALRRMPEASSVGLVLPRFLLRLPYGADTDPAERVEFEEFGDQPLHGQYLWGNPAFACACLLGEAFSSSGWDMQPGEVLDITDLPLHVYERGSERVTKPCAEALFTVEAAEAIMGRGLMPLVSFKNQDRIRLARFQSVADPPTALAGRWG